MLNFITILVLFTEEIMKYYKNEMKIKTRRVIKMIIFARDKIINKIKQVITDIVRKETQIRILLKAVIHTRRLLNKLSIHKGIKFAFTGFYTFKLSGVFFIFFFHLRLEPAAHTFQIGNQARVAISPINLNVH